MTVNAPIYHLASPADAKKLSEASEYSADSLETEGFIHCCSATQLTGVIQRYYAEASQLTLLVIEPGELQAELVYENTVGGEELFPHVYGKINSSAINETRQLNRQQIEKIVAGEPYL